MFVADYGNHCIRQIAAATGVVSTLAGTGETRGYADGQGAAARFHFPNGLACDATGTLFVADGNNHRIRVVR